MAVLARKKKEMRWGVKNKKGEREGVIYGSIGLFIS